LPDDFFNPKSESEAVEKTYDFGAEARRIRNNGMTTAEVRSTLKCSVEELELWQDRGTADDALRFRNADGTFSWNTAAVFNAAKKKVSHWRAAAARKANKGKRPATLLMDGGLFSQDKERHR
jgi:hypothetical protein